MGKAAEEWNDWVAEEQQRGDKGHEEQMLHHVGAKECVGKAIERRGDGEPDGGEAKKERSQPPNGKEDRARFANSEPATGVYRGRDEDRRREEERRRPMLKDGAILRRHGDQGTGLVSVGHG